MSNAQLFVYVLITNSLEFFFAKSEYRMKFFCIFVPCNKLKNRQLK